MMPLAADDSKQGELIESEIGLDLRGIAPSREWLQLLSEPRDEARVRAFVKNLYLRGVLELGRQDLSWSVDSLYLVGAVLERLNSQLHLSLDAEVSSPPGSSLLNDELLKDRALRQQEKKVQRAEYLARRAAWTASGSKKS